MNTLKLWFSGGPPPELQRTYFEHHLLAAPLKTVRGKTHGAYFGCGTFQWTPAVQALCSLLLIEESERIDPQNSGQPALEGDIGTPSASLNFALGKQPGWLGEMFGIDSSGQALARRLIKRSNPYYKRGGPIALSLNRAAASDLVFEFFLDGIRLESPADLRSLAALISRSWKPQRHPKINSEPRSLADLIDVSGDSSSSDANCGADLRAQRNIDPLIHFGRPVEPRDIDAPLKAALRALLKHEVLRCLWKTDIFGTKALKAAVSSLQNNPSYIQIAGARALPVSAIDLELGKSNLIGCIESEDSIKRELCGERPLKVGIGVVASSIRAIFYYLKFAKGYNIEINDRYAHSMALLRRAEADDFDDQPDLFPLGVAYAARLISRGESSAYRPLMFLPRNSLRIVASAAAERKKKYGLEAGRYAFIHEMPSSEQFYFDDLARRGKLQRNRLEVEHMEPDEAFAALRQGDPDFKAISFFPHYCFNNLYNNCRYLDAAGSDLQFRETVLFARREILDDQKRARAIDIAIRDAWLILRQGGAEFETVLSMMIEEQQYLKTLKRCAGLYRLKELPAAADNIASAQRPDSAVR